MHCIECNSILDDYEDDTCNLCKKEQAEEERKSRSENGQ